jgi:colanic acid biosynthesis protein WcaH
MQQRLDEQVFKTVVASTPLVSIDLIVQHSNGQVLLGRRTNRPAKGYWFVPGGRIYKDETFDQAFRRLTKIELGQEYSMETSQFLGPYQHLYTDNFSGSDFSTHYVVLGYKLELNLEILSLPAEQHNQYQWWNVSELLESDQVHSNTKTYFLNEHK